jgi:hypothetical protein
MQKYKNIIMQKKNNSLNLFPKENYLDVNTTPFIFNIKKQKSIKKTLKYINSDTGKMRHYTPASQEWYNSIYTYNKNYLKSLPILDNSLMTILKGYANMIPGINTQKDIITIANRKNLKGKKRRLFLRKYNAKRVLKYKRFTPRKIFVGRGDLKHTSSKVVITLYTFSLLKIFLLRKIKRLIHFLYFPKKTLNLFITKDLTDSAKDLAKKRNLISYNRPLSLEEYLYTPDYLTVSESRTRKIRNLKYPITYYDANKTANYLVTFYEAYLSFTIAKVKKITEQLSIIINYFGFLTTLVNKRILTNKEKLFIFTPKAIKFNYTKYNKRFVFSIHKARKLYLARLLRFSWSLYINNLKFKHPLLISKLKPLVRNLYGKEVEFKLVELKKMHLSSDIFTQVIALKLKNRKNKLLNVLSSSLSKVVLPNESRIGEKYSTFNKEEYIVNKVRNSKIISMFDLPYSLESNNTLNNTLSTKNISKNISKNSKSITSNDSLNDLLLGFFPLAHTLEIDLKKNSSKFPVSLSDYVIKNLKHLSLSGVRIETKGRLTKRSTAEKSVFKMNYKGGLKNVDSSFKGLPVVMLRGFFKSNVQYSLLHSKNRNGAYGIKGWVGNK